MKRLRRLIAATAGFSLVAAGATVAGAAPTGGGDDLSGESIEVAAVWTGAEQERFELVLEEFADETGADVTFTSTGDDISAALEPRIAGGDPPDVAMLPQPGLLADFAARGALQSIEDIAGATIDENYAPIWRELGTVDGTLYGVWFKAANKSLVWYSREVFRDAGVRPTDEFDTFLENAQTVSDFGVTPFSVGGANGWVLTDLFENIYLAQAGPDMYDQLARHEIPWTDQSVKDALATFAEVYANDLIVGGTEGALQTEFPGSVQDVFAGDPEGAMVIEGDFVASTIAEETDARVGRQARVFNFPAIDGEAPVVTGGDVAALFTDSEAGQAFIEFLATPEAAEAWAEEGGYLSPNQELDSDVYPNRTLRRIATALVESDLVRFDLSDLQPAAFGATDGQGMWKLFQDFLANPSDVDGITQQLEDAATQA
ncbi:MAG: ABC transporter substrate-binding protein, partial [Acidimicrobiia bacterium]